MLDDFREAAAERYVELVPDDLSERLAPRPVRSSQTWPRARTCGSRSSPATSSRSRG